ncbi:MAG TPA: hypothetical protein ENI52_01235 [Thermoplasmata archaeon]|nr:hypothetical protein [Thermoplasmata archaeon]
MKKPKFYWAILSNKLNKAEVHIRIARSLVPRRNLRVIRVDSKYVIIRKIYQEEFKNDKKWRIHVRDYQHPRVLRWLKKIKKGG